MRKIPTHMLRPGMKTGRRLYDSQGFLLLNSGVKLTTNYIKYLKKMGIESLYIENELAPDLIVEDVIREETRHLAYNKVQKALNTLRENPEQKQSNLVMIKEEFSPVLDTIIGELLDTRDLTVNLSDIRVADDYTFSHSVNVAVLSIIAGLSSGLGRSELRELGFGSFLHDIGKTLLPLNILNKNGRLKRAEMEIVKTHPDNGYELAVGKDLYGSKPLAVIHQHHERVDGSGYPQGLHGELIEPLSKICAIADVYDALTSDRPYRRAFMPHKALNIMQAKSKGFHMPTMQTFFQHLPAYPVGTVVGLNDGYLGIVVQNTVGYTYHPKVRIISTKENFEKIQPFEVDLKQFSTLVVDRVYQEEELVELYKKFRVD